MGIKMAALTVVFSLLSNTGDKSNRIIMAVCIVFVFAAAAAVPLLTIGYLMRLRFGSHPRKGCRG